MMKPKADPNDGKEDPVTELGLSLGYSTVCSRKAVRNDPSAGANAGSLSFGAANPVSELVWSPQGLTLKYADCSFMERQSFRFLGVGPSNMVIPTSHAEKIDIENIASTKGEIASPEGNNMASEANASKDAPDVGDSRNRDRNSNHDLYDQVEKFTSLAYPGRNVGRTIELLQNEPDPADHCSHDKASGCGSKKQVTGVASGAALSPMDIDNAVDGGTLSRLVENNQVGKTSFPLSEKLESMDENYIREPDSQIAGASEIKFAASGSEVKIKSIDGMKNQLEMLVPPHNHYPENGRDLENQSADNGRASFDTDADGRLLKEKNDSRDSVESCNRAMVAKKRWRSDQPLFIGSKRAKQIHDRPSSSSFSGQNSSFMNWISNIMKGLSRPTMDAGAPLSFAFADPGNSPEDVACAYTSKQNARHTGFRSFFQRIYQPNEDAPEVGLPVIANEARMGSASIGGFNEVRTISADQIQRREGTDDVSEPLLPSNNEFHEDTPVAASGPSSLPLGTHGHISVYKGVSGSYSVEDKVLVNKKALLTSNSPSEHKTLIADSAEDKTPQFGWKGDFGSLWMNRFSSKASCSLLKMEEAVHGPGGATDDCRNSVKTLVHSPKSGGSKMNTVNGNVDDYHNERTLRDAGNKLTNCHVGGTEFSDGFARAASCSEENNVRKVDVILPSKCLKSSEDMASTFAQRVDALRRNIPSRENCDAKANVLCLFCGMMGHQLRVCTKVAKSDLKGLLTAAHTHDPSNMSPACIKCFQLNHWAISCPHNQVQGIKRDGFGVWVRHDFSDATSVQNEQTLLKNCHGKADGNLKWRAVSASGSLTRAREDEEISTATNQKDQTEITTGCDSVLEEASKMPKGIFDMIRNLHLSRTDILKWMNSGSSLIHLEGYFLRLRLGKWGDKLGGSGYRVACINGMTQIDRSPADGRIILPVYVGGIKCLVGSQYISNHDFLEDELKEWWHTAAKGGARMPSADNLLFKVEERRRLGI